MRWTWGRLAAAAVVACLGCQNESLGGHPPGGTGGRSDCPPGAGLCGGAFGSGEGGAVGSGGLGAVGAGGDVGMLGSGGAGAVGAGGDAGGGGAIGAGGSGGGAGSVATGGAAGAQFCGQLTTAVPSGARPDVLVVLDRASSMNDDTNGMSCPGWCGPSSKWETMAAALDQLVNTNRSVNWGITYYPSDGGCGVTTSASVDVAPSDGLAIESSLFSSALLPAGDAPTAAAITAAVVYLQSLADGNPKYLLLATDGHLGCGSPPVDPIPVISEALAAGIPTFVVGMVPAWDTGTAGLLTQMSVAGGMAPQNPNLFYTTADFGPQFPPVPTPLDPTGACQLPLPYPATAAQLAVGLQSNGQLVAVPQDPNDGWSFASSGQARIVFNGTSCAEVAAAEPGGEIVLSYDCGPNLVDDHLPAGVK